MSNYAGLSDLVAQIKEASGNLAAGDARTDARLKQIEREINQLYLKSGRPGAEWRNCDDLERKDAIGLCEIRHFDRSPKADAITTKSYEPGSDEIDEAIAATRGFQKILRHGDINRLDNLERKSLSAFAFGTNGFMLSPVRANRVLSCLTDPSDLSGLVDRVTISGPSVKFTIDNLRTGMGAWACEVGCFANNPQPDLQDGLGEMEIKPESIRYVACVNRDLVEDASIDFENWLYDKINQGMRAKINEAILVGDGVGKPLGMLNPKSGIPVCETSPATAPGQFSWQDLVMLKHQVPIQWHNGASFLMNQNTYALLACSSDAQARPLWTTMPGSEPGYTLAGSPITIASQIPDVAPGSVAVAFGNWKRTYTIVERKAVSIQVDNYSAGFCILYKAEARVGGATTCPNSARLLRIR